MCGASLPRRLITKLETIQDDSLAVQELGISHATEQCDELLSKGVPGIHFYTLNRSNSTLQILKNIKSQFQFLRE